MPRLGYSKSRTGCESCKRRRVKCDENRPCNACLRHGVECSLLSAATQGPRMTPQRPKSQQLTKHASRRRQPKAKPVIQIAPSWQPDPFTSTLHDPISEDQNEIGALWTTDLQLMHHWTAVTSLTLPRASEVSRIWQVTVAQLSFQNEPLLHQVLATSAYHLAYLNPTERVTYSLVASKHQNDASQALRHAIKDLSVKNCDASFAAASLVLIGSFASRAVHHYESPSPNIGDMIYIFKLAKGMNQVLYAFQNVIQGGCLGDLFMLAGKPPRSVSMERVCEKLTQLQKFLKTEHIDQTTGAIVDIEAHRFIEGIESAVQTAQVPQLRMTMTWPITMSDEFLWLLGEKDPSALVLMAYYCLLVHETVPYAWYTAGWGDSVVSDIATQVSGPWQEAIQWPLERILNSPS